MQSVHCSTAFGHLLDTMCSLTSMLVCMCRTCSFTEEDAIRIGADAGAELKAEAGPEFFSWSP